MTWYEMNLWTILIQQKTLLITCGTLQGSSTTGCIMYSWYVDKFFFLDKYVDKPGIKYQLKRGGLSAIYVLV